jgi:hypothetical protein
MRTSGSSGPSSAAGPTSPKAPSSPGGGAFSLQLGLPGVEPAPISLQSLVDAQREWIAAYERFDELRARWFVEHPDDELPSPLRRQAS